MKKRCMALALAFVMTCGLTACGGKDSEKASQQTEKAQDSEGNAGQEEITVRDLSKAEPQEAWEYAEEIIQTVREQEPKFGDYEVSIADFGAQATEGEVTKEEERAVAIGNTKAIYAAICDVNEQKEGGTVRVPAGTWYTAAIHLKSNVNLHLDEGAVLKFATDTDLYAGELMKELYGSELTFSRNGGIELYNYSAFIYAYQADNIALTGKGTIDGQASAIYWIPWRTLGEPTAGNHLLMQGETNVPVEERMYGESEGEAGVATDGYIRPNLVEFIDCDRVLMEDFTTANSPAWQLHPTYCSYVTIRRVNMHSLMANNDGIDPDSCKYMVIEENVFNTGDDCIAIKSGKNADGRRVGIASENIVIQNNTMEEGHGGITLGSEASAGIRNIFARDNHMENLAQECCLRFKNSPLRGNVLENIYYKDTYVSAFKNNRDMIVFQSDYGLETEMEYFQSEGFEPKQYKPVTRHVYIDGFCATQPENVPTLCENAIKMTGTEDSPIQDVHFSNIEVERPTAFMKASYIEDVTLEQATITKNKKPDVFENCKNVTYKDVSFVDSKLSKEEDYAGIEGFVSDNLSFMAQ